jgi:hypothetical protein
VSLIATWFFSWILEFQGVCACALVCMRYFFPRLIRVVKCAVAGSLIATGD